MDFEIPADLAAYLAELDEFIDTQIRPLVEAILRHPAFTADDAYLAKVKSPA